MSGGSRSTLSTKLCRSRSKPDLKVFTITGDMQACNRVDTVKIRTKGTNAGSIDVLVMQGKPLDSYLLFGIDAIKKLGSVFITRSRNVKFEEILPVYAALRVDVANFCSKFDEQRRILVERKMSDVDGEKYECKLRTYKKAEDLSVGRTICDM